MPRPTAAQLAYGSATIVVSTLALLVFTRTTDALGVAAIGVASMALGLLVALLLPIHRSARATTAARTARPARTGRPADGRLSASAGHPARVPAPRVHAGAEHRVSEHSLRR